MKSGDIGLRDEENVLLRKVFEIFPLDEKIRIHEAAVIADAFRRCAFLTTLDFDIDVAPVMVERMDVEMDAAAAQV